MWFRELVNAANYFIIYLVSNAESGELRKLFVKAGMNISWLKVDVEVGEGEGGLVGEGVVAMVVETEFMFVEQIRQVMSFSKLANTQELYKNGNLKI